MEVRSAAQPHGPLPRVAPVRHLSEAPATVRARVYTVHGADVPGLTGHGKSAMRRLASELRRSGVSEVTSLEYNGDSFLANQLAPLWEVLLGRFSKQAARQVAEDLAARPLAKGEQVHLIGHSLGTRVAVNLADKLAARGVPVGSVALLEPKNGLIPPAVGRLPRVGRALIVENQAGVKLKNPHHVPVAELLIPGQSHAQVIERPTHALLKAIGRLVRGG
ncbi:MAG: hypothetical protein VKS61_08675 [Candidatus Sericytochromatia bacterium]|nr:hypothetical protein [Candidatus Sericytochromatia bacterium]